MKWAQRLSKMAGKQFSGLVQGPSQPDDPPLPLGTNVMALMTTETVSDVHLTTDSSISFGALYTSVSSHEVSEWRKLVEGLKKDDRKPIVRCDHCGQWAAAYCACRFCGAPVG